MGNFHFLKIPGNGPKTLVSFAHRSLFIASRFGIKHASIDSTPLFLVLSGSLPMSDDLREIIKSLCQDRPHWLSFDYD